MSWKIIWHIFYFSGFWIRPNVSSRARLHFFKNAKCSTTFEIFLANLFLKRSYSCLLQYWNLSCLPASKAHREVANLTQRKNLHTLAYGVRELLGNYAHIYTVLPIWGTFHSHSRNQSFHPFLIRLWTKQEFVCLSVTNFHLNYQPFLDNFWLKSYLDSRHSQGIQYLQHKFHLYLIYVLHDDQNNIALGWDSPRLRPEFWFFKDTLRIWII